MTTTTSPRLRQIVAVVDRPASRPVGEAAAVEPHHDRPLAVVVPGVQTLRKRQSSLAIFISVEVVKMVAICFESSVAGLALLPVAIWMQGAPNFEASAGDVHAASFPGALKRFAPVGAAA